MQSVKTNKPLSIPDARRFRVMWGLLVCIILGGCAGGLSHGLQQSLSVIVPTKVDFAELEYYAKRSNSAYDPMTDIRDDYPLATRITTVQPSDIRYFIETDSAAKTQTISVRGTAEKKNVWEDIETALIPDRILGISVHRGFQADAQAILQDARPHLRKTHAVRITGHSLGGAVAAILGLYLEKEGFTVSRIVSFGEPRFTTQEVKSASLSNTTRVVHDRDVVPMLPPHSVFGKYQHFSAEVILRPGKHYVYLNVHDSDRLSVGEFWRNATNFSLADHHMDGYLSNIQEKKKTGSQQIPYFFKQSRKVIVQN